MLNRTVVLLAASVLSGCGGPTTARPSAPATARTPAVVFFESVARALKPGGVFGVVQHRAASDVTDAEAAATTGYMPEAWVIAQCARVGLQLDVRSEINANPRDTRDHPNGVWSLPPTLRGGDEGRAGFVAIGESDRMTLRFVKRAP